MLFFVAQHTNYTFSAMFDGMLTCLAHFYRSGGMTPAEVTEEVAPPADVPAEETAASTVVEAYSTAADAPVEPLATVSAAWSGETQAPPPPKNFGPVGKREFALEQRESVHIQTNSRFSQFSI